jgi:hypothetical protein
MSRIQVIYFIIILIVCYWGYSVTEDINVISNTPKPFIQQLLRLTWLGLVGLFTYLPFKKEVALKNIIIGVFGFFIFFLGITGIIEWKFRLLSENAKEFFAGIRLFLSSPLPFLFILLISKKG